MKKKIMIIVLVIFGIGFLTGLSIFIYLTYFQTNKFAVITYHNIVDEVSKEDMNTVNISEEKFEKQIAWLSKHGYKSLTMNDLYEWKMNNKKLPSKSILITFDDGWKSYYTKAIPILEKYNMKSSVFVIFSATERSTQNNDNIYMTFDDINDIINNHKDMEILSHSYDLHLKKYTEEDNYDVYMKDIQKVNDIQPDIKYYAYPYGRRTEGYIKALRDNDYHFAFTFGPYDFVTKESDNYQMPRIGVFESLPDWKFKLKLLLKI